MHEGEAGDRPRRDVTGTQAIILAVVGMTVIVGLMVVVAAMPWIVAR